MKCYLLISCTITFIVFIKICVGIDVVATLSDPTQGVLNFDDLFLNLLYLISLCEQSQKKDIVSVNEFSLNL